MESERDTATDTTTTEEITMDLTTYNDLIDSAAHLTELSAAGIHGGVEEIRLLAFRHPGLSRLKMVKFLRNDSHGGYSLPEAIYLMMAAEIAGVIVVTRLNECASTIRAS